MTETKKKTKQSDTELPKEAKVEKRTKSSSTTRAVAKGGEEDLSSSTTRAVAKGGEEDLSSSTFGINVEEMARVGLHFGHRVSRFHPKMKPYLFGVRNAVHIIDLEKTAEKFKEALKFIQQLISENKVLLLVGTKVQAKDLVKLTAKECGLPYVSERWLGGTFTNFETIKKRIDYFKGLERKKAEGELEKYTKKERADIDKELRDLELKVGGIKNLIQLPDAIFVLDIKKDALAIKEAKRKGVKIIAVADTNTDPTLADYPIPANDDAISSLKYILEKVGEVIKKSKPKLEQPLETQNPKPKI